MSPGESPSSRTAKTRMIANATLEKRFDVAVHPACARRFGLPRTKRRPSFSSVHMLGLRPSTSATSGRGSSLADPEDEEARSEEAERVEENGVGRGEDLDEHAAETRPADLRGRAADLELRVPLDDLVALDERREVRLYATSKKTWKIPTRKPTTKSCPSVSASAT